MVVYGLIVIALGLVFEAEIFASLGADKTLFPVMSEYYRIIFPFLFFQFIVIQIYFFIRLDGFPKLSGHGACHRRGGQYYPGLPVYWRLRLGGLLARRWRRGSQRSVSLAVMLAYFVQPQRKISRLGWRQKNWREVFQAAYNGISEFINEVSGALIGFIFNWMLIQRAGVTGVAAITLVNYLLFIGFMAYFAISDSIQVIVSQNYGARKPQRIQGIFAHRWLS